MKITIPKDWRIDGYALVNHTSRCEPQRRVEVHGDSVCLTAFDRHNDEPEIPLAVVQAATKLAEFRKLGVEVLGDQALALELAGLEVPS